MFRVLLLCLVVVMSSVATAHAQAVDVMLKEHEKPVRLRPVIVTPLRKAASIQMARSDAASDSSVAAKAMLAPAALAMRRPSLEPMATHIVSVGRTVSFDLRPTVADGRVAVVHIDRLPRSASFEHNPDGSRTFYWRTVHRDQGEHVFRFTSSHPDDPALISYSEVVIIVGDPSLGGSEPQLPAPPVDAHDNGIKQVEARTVIDESADAPLAYSDPFSENFDPTLDRDLDSGFDELDENDEWAEPELR